MTRPDPILLSAAQTALADAAAEERERLSIAESEAILADARKRGNT